VIAPPIVTGERVTLRPYRAGFSDEELAILYRWARDPEVLALSGGSPLDVTFERFCTLFRAELPRHNSAREQLFVILDERGRLIGRTGLFRLDNETSTAEAGIVIGERSHWSQGYGRDALRTLVDFGFGELRLTRIMLYTYPENDRARRAYEAVGFRPVRALKRFSFDRGTHTELEMEITVGQT